MALEDQHALLERAYRRIREQKQQIAELSAKSGDDQRIAIVGFACRLPGGAIDGPSFWNVIGSGRDAFTSIDDRRWSISSSHDPLGRTQGKTYTLAAGLIDDVDAFDASFFGIPAIEAETLDPQQRMLLEVSWHAFEDAGLDARALKGSSTGVFVGLTTDDYSRIHARSQLPVTTYTGLGSAKSMAAGRLAYFYDFHGPALQLDTTCSSSLVALHLAAKELRDGSCDLALVGGANAIISPDTSIGFCEMKALSRRGTLRAFDDDADGYVRGEGCGVLILKRYSDAVRDGNRVHGVVLGTAVNHDGRTNGLTAPNPAAQEKVIRRALAAAGCTSDDIDYVEAHGTGTKLGDLIEANALGSAYSGRSRPLRIGSLKANIGHLEAAAGVASIIKVLLGFKHGYIPGQVNFQEPNSRIDWASLKLEISNSDWKWHSGSTPRRAGISAFGMSGTNAHVILSEPTLTERAPDETRPALPLHEFVRQRHWLRLPTVTAKPQPKHSGFPAMLLKSDPDCRSYEVELSGRLQPHLDEHKLFGVVVVAGASWISLWLTIALDLFGDVPIQLEALKFHRPLVIQNDSRCTVKITLRRKGAHWMGEASVDGRTYCETVIQLASLASKSMLQYPVESSSSTFDADAFYNQFVDRGYTLGPAFRWMATGFDDEGQSWRQMRRPKLSSDADAYPIFPGLVDSCFHALAGILAEDANLSHGTEIVVPAEVACIRFYPQEIHSSNFHVVASRAKTSDTQYLSGDINLAAEGHHHALLEIESLQFRKLSNEMLDRAIDGEAHIHLCTPRWVDVATDGQPSSMEASIAIGSDAIGLASEIFSANSIFGSESSLAMEGLALFKRDVIPEIVRFLETKPEGARIALLGPSTPGNATDDQGMVLAALTWAALISGIAEVSANRSLRFAVLVPGLLDGKQSSILDAGLVGFLRSAFAEHPLMDVQFVDGPLEEVRKIALARHNGVPTTGDYLFVDGKWRRRELSEIAPANVPDINLSGGVVLVTGGSGALATNLLSWLQSAGADDVVLLSRSCSHQSETDNEGRRITHRPCDVSNGTDVQSVFDEVHRSGRNVIAVVHAAGVLADKALPNLSPDDLRSAMAPKVVGAKNLMSCWHSEKLKLVVAISSLVSLVGSPAQAAYTAANAAVDRWISQLREAGIPATVLNLGPVDAGMAARLNDVSLRRLERLGLRLLPVDKIAASILTSTTLPNGQLAVYSATRKNRFANAQSGLLNKASSGDPSNVLDELCRAMAELVGNDSATGNEDTPLTQLGADSLLAVELAAWIQQRFSVDFSMEKVLSLSTLRAIAVHIDVLTAGQGSWPAERGTGAGEGHGTHEKIQWVEGEL